MGSTRNRPFTLCAAALLCLAALSGCDRNNLNRPDGISAPGVAGAAETDSLIVGHRLMAAREYELALDAYTRAAGEQGLNGDTLTALGSANLRLGRLGQAERLLRRAVDEDPDFAQAWNNLGVVLMERGDPAEAAIIFRRAFATPGGQTDEIRQNLALAIEKRDDPLYDPSKDNNGFQLMRRGVGDFVLTSDA